MLRAVGIPGSRRVTLLAEAALRLGHPLEVVPWTAVIAGEIPVAPLLCSPGGDASTAAALARLGDGDGYTGLVRAAVAWEGAQPANRVRTHTARELGCLFDKRWCQEHLRSAGVAVPEILPVPVDWDTLVALLDTSPAVFLKPRHGSSAAGILAIRRGPGGRRIGWTTAVVDGDRVTNRVGARPIRDERVLRELVERLVPLGLHAERWIPKVAVGGRSADLRVLCVAGEARHTVVRVADGPLTNLHAGGQRAPLSALVDVAGADAVGDALAVATRAAAAFPGTLAVGWDVLIPRDGGPARIVEGNAFGDLLPGTSSRGEDPWTAQLVHLLRP